MFTLKEKIARKWSLTNLSNECKFVLFRDDFAVKKRFFDEHCSFFDFSREKFQQSGGKESACEVKNNLCLFERPFKIQKSGAFRFEIYFFVLEILTFFYYAN